MYLSVTSQLRLGCLSMGLPPLGPDVFGIHCACVSAIAWIATLVASAMAFVIASFMIDLPSLTYDFAFSRSSLC